MSNLSEIRQRLGRLSQLSKRTREKFATLRGPEGEELKKKAKKEGTRIGIGAGISFFGLIIASVASAYVMAVIILLVNIALDKLWLSALIVVGGFLIIGGAIIAVGAGMAGSSAKKLSRTKDDVTKQIKQAVEEMKAEIEELLKLARRETEEPQRQMVEMAKKVAPIAGGAYLGYRILKRAMKSRREKRKILRVIESYEEARTREERS